MKQPKHERPSGTLDKSSQGLVFAARTSLRRSPVMSGRTLLVPIDGSDGPELWEAVEGSRWHLERWLPWVPFNSSPEASMRYAEA
ncbi:MAG TPA: hypothetical protein VNN72_09970, partial [Polyangiaceae bacterium]|nr:hypothetical protein [Polyangiaceae bacterium]